MARQALDSTHKRTIKAIERLQKDIDTQKASIANRWNNAQIGQNYKRDIQVEEVRAVLLTIRKNSEKELNDDLFLEAGKTHRQIADQGVFYDSPVKTLARAGLGDPKRSDYLRQLKGAGAAEVAHMAQLAVSRNVTLAASLLSVIDGFQTANRPFTAHHLAELFAHGPHLAG